MLGGTEQVSVGLVDDHGVGQLDDALLDALLEVGTCR